MNRVVGGLSFGLLYYLESLCSLFLQLSEKGPVAKWTIYKNVSDKSKKNCLSLILEVCLSSVIISTAAYWIFSYIIDDYLCVVCLTFIDCMSD